MQDGLLHLNISPLDHRYAQTFLAEKLREYLSEEARIRYQGLVEVAVCQAWEEIGIAPEGCSQALKKALNELEAKEVYEQEKKTRHDIRALVRVLQKKIPAKYRPYVHLGVTSYDIIDTARSLQLKSVVLDIVLPVLKKLLKIWLEISWRERRSVQVGRTHGQHAVPTTFGYSMFLFCNRLSEEILAVQELAQELKGKISGPVGAYNGISLLTSRPLEFEKMVLKNLGIQPAPVTSQIIPLEDTLHLCHHIIAALGVLADFSDDMRHLQRTEIQEVGEEFLHDQVGSSTMPQKQNPINFENVKSMWKNFVPRILTLYMDQLSEHQRDLTNSASSRFYVEIIAGLVLSAERLIKVCERLQVNRVHLQENLKLSGGYVLAEAAYLLLARNGDETAHERIRKISLKGKSAGLSFEQVLKEYEEELKPLLKDDWDYLFSMLKDPGIYIGGAVEKIEKDLPKLAKQFGWEIGGLNHE